MVILVGVCGGVELQRFSYLSHLSCPRCGATHSTEAVQQVCTCGSPLVAEYDLQAAARAVSKMTLENRPQRLWRYHEWLPVSDPQYIVSLQEMVTPLVTLPATSRSMDVSGLIVKDESALPSGTFKARGATVGISRAKELGVTALALPTNGNAGAAWALYAARAGIQATIIMPDTAPMTPRKECSVAGANLYVTEGTIADAGRIVSRACKQHGWYDVSTLKEPYRLEGKKTMGYEIAEQFGWTLPDVIVYPTGGGAGVIGIYKAFAELQAMGWVEGPLPRMAVVQAENCAPLVVAHEAGAKTSEPWDHASTIAFGMRVPKALGDFLILDIIKRSHGTAITVTDEEIIQERAQVVQHDGFHICPEGAAALAGVRRLRQSGFLRDQDRVLVMNTGSGLKYVDQIADAAIRIDVTADI